MSLQQASSSTVPSLVRKSSQRSNVWDHFSQPVAKKAQCKHCLGKYTYTGGTTNLSNHLQTCKAFKDTRDSQKDSEPVSTAAAAADCKKSVSTVVGTKPMQAFVVSQSRRPCSSVRASQIRGLIAGWVTSDMRPLGISNDPGFRQLMSFIEPSFTVPSRTTVASMVRRRHECAKKELAAKLADVTSIAITTDAWTSKAVVSFVTYTGHFVTDDWSLVSYVLETKRFSGSHTAVNLAAATNAVLDKFHIPVESLQCLVHDEAANQMAASRILRDEHGWDFQACAAHRLQTCIRHAISSSRPVSKLLAAARQMVGHFHHSAKSTEALNTKQQAMGSGGKTGAPLRVVQDVPTRWNSSFLMLQRLLELRLPIMAVLEDPELTKPAHRQLLLKDGQWHLAKELVASLEGPAKATTVLGGQTYCTQSLVVPVAKSLLRTLQIDSAGSSMAIDEFRTTLAAEIEVKFSLDPFDPLSLPSLSAALDPRSRSLGFLDDDDDKAAVKVEILRRVREVTEDCEDSEECEECEDEPPAKLARQDDTSMFFFYPVDQQQSSSDAEAEVTQYFTGKPAHPSTDPLQWWKTNCYRFPGIAKVAKKILCIPATSVPSERIFSAAGIIVNKLRASLSNDNVDALIFLHVNRDLKAARAGVPVAVPPEVVPRMERFEEEEADDLPPLPNL